MNRLNWMLPVLALVAAVGSLRAQIGESQLERPQFLRPVTSLYSSLRAPAPFDADDGYVVHRAETYEKIWTWFEFAGPELVPSSRVRALPVDHSIGLHHIARDVWWLVGFDSVTSMGQSRF